MASLGGHLAQVCLREERLLALVNRPREDGALGHDEVGRFRGGQGRLSTTEAMGRALTDLYIRLYAGAALDDMLAVFP